MTFRTLVLATSALLMAAGVSSADAATRQRMKHHSSVHKASMHRPAKGHMATRGMSRSRDTSGDAAVDQLNAQSLNSARGGAAPSAQPSMQPAAQ